MTALEQGRHSALMRAGQLHPLALSTPPKFHGQTWSTVSIPEGSTCPNFQHAPAPVILYPSFPSVACISTIIIPSGETHALPGIRIPRCSLKFVGNHRKSSVFMGVVMKLDDIRADYLNSLSLPYTIPTRLVPASRTLLSILPGQGFPV
jgi:hypothetical protein